MRSIEREDCECNCRCRSGGMHGHTGSGIEDLTTEETAERLRHYKDDLAEEIKFIDKRIAELKAEDKSKNRK